MILIDLMCPVDILTLPEMVGFFIVFTPNLLLSWPPHCGTLIVRATSPLSLAAKLRNWMDFTSYAARLIFFFVIPFHKVFRYPFSFCPNFK